MNSIYEADAGAAAGSRSRRQLPCSSCQAPGRRAACGRCGAPSQAIPTKVQTWSRVLRDGRSLRSPHSLSGIPLSLTLPLE